MLLVQHLSTFPHQYWLWSCSLLWTEIAIVKRNRIGSAVKVNSKPYFEKQSLTWFRVSLIVCCQPIVWWTNSAIIKRKLWKIQFSYSRFIFAFLFSSAFSQIIIVIDFRSSLCGNIRTMSRRNHQHAYTSSFLNCVRARKRAPERNAARLVSDTELNAQ